MSKRTCLVRSTVFAAVAAAWFIVSSAQAGVLGGGGIGGGIGGGLSGGLGPRSLDVGGTAAAQAGHGGAALPRGDKLAQRSGAAAQSATNTSASATATAAGSESTVIGKSVEAQQSATGNASAAATATRERADRAHGAADAAATTGAGAARNAARTTPEISSMGGTDVSARGAHTSLGGSAQTSRNADAVRAETSAQGAVRH